MKENAKMMMMEKDKAAPVVVVQGGTKISMCDPGGDGTIPIPKELRIVAKGMRKSAEEALVDLAYSWLNAMKTSRKKRLRLQGEVSSTEPTTKANAAEPLITTTTRSGNS